MKGSVRFFALIALSSLLFVRNSGCDFQDFSEIIPVPSKEVIAYVTVVENSSDRRSNLIMSRLITADWKSQMREKGVAVSYPDVSQMPDGFDELISEMELPVAVVQTESGKVLTKWTVKEKTVDEFERRVDKAGKYASPAE